eukprot:CAMPEP_0178935276 /NCGR_PEP_ID=MMETSP0786-20121207/24431_1 /TAXON_ID=186022 /ORGANISM="Thalassionema frauenfeldii, Strain CCMP 1798" /LENGTH=1600 /DNA_ID=CAMNT_0020613357 /DNA_START=111 /DNA_END=4914 /DNA_ORIENTATION=+
MAVTCHAIIMFCFSWLAFFLTILVDIEELKGFLPDWLSKTARWVDGTLLKGDTYSGREWNSHSYVLSGPAMSQKVSLLKCPPPNVKTQDRHGMFLSENTARHALGMKFCYEILSDVRRHSEETREHSCKEAGDAAPRLQALSDHNIFSQQGGSWLNDSYTILEEDGNSGANRRLLPSLSADEGNATTEYDSSGLEGGKLDEALMIRRTCSDSDIGTLMDELEDSASTVGMMDDPRSRLVQRNTSNGDYSTLSELGNEMDWSEVGARIGMRILQSEHVQRAVASQDTAERIMDIARVESNFVSSSNEFSHKESKDSDSFFQTNSANSRKNNETEPHIEKPQTGLTSPMKPVHTMWTKASSVNPPSSSPRLSAINKKGGSPLNRFRRFSRSPVKPNCSTKVRGEFGSLQYSKSPSYRNLTQNKISPEKTKVEKETTKLCEELPSNYSKKTGNVLTIPKVQDLKNIIKTENHCRPILQPGVKIVVPIFPIKPVLVEGQQASKVQNSSYQMATVIRSKRISVNTGNIADIPERQLSNCLSITVSLDKAFLRDGGFAQMTIRIMDEWSNRFMPRHSKFPIGSCVATTYGVGVLIGWRVEDDCHIVRALWKRRGAGSAHAYLNRNAIHGQLEAAVGFQVETTIGKGVVVSYLNAGRNFVNGRYFVLMKEVGRHKDHVLEFNRGDILSCSGPEFVPVIELIREAAQYRIQVDNYKMALKRQLYGDIGVHEKKWHSFSTAFQTIWKAFLKAVEEDKGFDDGVKNFFSGIINFLERLEATSEPEIINGQPMISTSLSEISEATFKSIGSDTIRDKPNPFAWFVEDIFGDVFRNKEPTQEDIAAATRKEKVKRQYDKTYDIIRALMKTVAIARADCSNQPTLKLALLFVRKIINIQQKNVSAVSLAVWERAIHEIITTFGPMKTRLENIGKGIAKRIEKHGNRAKAGIIRFVDIIVSDETLLVSLERGAWDVCLEQLEKALVQARIIDEESRENYHRTIKFITDHFAPGLRGSAADRNQEKLAYFAKFLKWLASPARSLLRLIKHDSTLEILQGILIRVFRNDPAASQMITIHASNMTTLRDLRMLSDFAIFGKVWKPLLEAADEEFVWAVSRMPESSREVMDPLSQLFSLGVAQFHKVGGSDLTSDWMDFLLQEEAIKLIHEIDVKLILAVESVSKDFKDVMVVLPYYPSIDDDILNLMDEVNLDEFLREASNAITDSDRLAEFIQEKTSLAIQRFLNYLPKMAIPVDKRDLSEHWVLSCQSEKGGDLTLSDVEIKRENLVCQVMGGERLFFPMIANDGDFILDCDIEKTDPEVCSSSDNHFLGAEECTILTEIRALLENAQLHGCWQQGIGGVSHQPTDGYVASVFQGIPLSSVLNTGIQLWQSLEIDDDELMEIAIKDVSHQIKLREEHEGVVASKSFPLESKVETSISKDESFTKEHSSSRQFNPRVDPTLLFCEMKKLTVNLDAFRFQIEKKKKTIFDPVFEGVGSLCIENVSIKVRVECRKERMQKLGSEVIVPVLQCKELEVKLEKVKFEVKDTGADWVLNKAVKHFANEITGVVETNLKQEIRNQIDNVLENVNAYVIVNPELMLRILGISIDDLEENQVWV